MLLLFGPQPKRTAVTLLLNYRQILLITNLPIEVPPQVSADLQADEGSFL